MQGLVVGTAKARVRTDDFGIYLGSSGVSGHEENMDTALLVECSRC